MKLPSNNNKWARKCIQVAGSLIAGKKMGEMNIDITLNGSLSDLKTIPGTSRNQKGRPLHHY